MAALLASTHKGTFLLALFPHTLLPETPSRSLFYCGLMLWLRGIPQQHPWEWVFHTFLLCALHIFHYAIFKCSLIKSPTFMSAAATKAWRRSSKDIHESSMCWQLLRWHLAHGQNHTSLYGTMCGFLPSQFIPSSSRCRMT